jgi:hypothetical protein
MAKMESHVRQNRLTLRALRSLTVSVVVVTYGQQQITSWSSQENWSTNFQLYVDHLPRDHLLLNSAPDIRPFIYITLLGTWQIQKLLKQKL